VSDGGKLDYYEVLQVSVNAEADTIHRIYRLLAQRYHPDNGETGNADKFHQVHEAFTVLSNPESRARYDVSYHQQRQDRWRLVSTGANSENDFEMEQIGRLTILEALYTRRP
jgi:DnaJ-class molecular chaperone